MSARHWTLVGAFAALGLSYVIFFTEWLRPAPIEVASQVRFSVQPPRFGRPAPKANAARGAMPDAAKATSTKNGRPAAPPQGFFPPPPAKTNPVVAREMVDRVGRPEKGAIDQAPGGVANVTFSLDNWYQLTRVRVEDVPADGTAPNVAWQLVGKSLPLNSLLYGRNPEGMKPLLAEAKAEPLKAGVPYRLIVEAGRRRGTNDFKTVEVTATE